jgi:hypothetical protein
MYEIQNIRQVTRRFCAMAAVTPQKRQCLIASSPPAASLLSAATSRSRWTLHAMAEQKIEYLKSKIK